MVYIHGERPASELSPALVNAHYDSVSTAPGLFPSQPFFKNQGFMLTDNLEIRRY